MRDAGEHCELARVSPARGLESRAPNWAHDVCGMRRTGRTGDARVPVWKHAWGTGRYARFGTEDLLVALVASCFVLVHVAEKCVPTCSTHP